MFELTPMIIAKQVTLAASTLYVMFANVPIDIPYSADKGMALGICVWVILSLRKDHAKTIEELAKTRKAFKAELYEERERSDRHLEVLNKQADGFDKIANALEKCPTHATVFKPASLQTDET